MLAKSILKHSKAKKAQIITFDFSTSLITFVIFIAIFIALFILSQKSEAKPDFEIEYAFANLENNLKYGPPEQDFFSDYRISWEKLQEFATSIGSGSINSYVIGQAGSAHGIGLDALGYDACLYFIDNNNTMIQILPSVKALGEISKTGNSCNNELSHNPCEEYDEAYSMLKPVLLDQGDISLNRIVQMNLVICKK